MQSSQKFGLFSLNELFKNDWNRRCCPVYSCGGVGGKFVSEENSQKQKNIKPWNIFA